MSAFNDTLCDTISPLLTTFYIYKEVLSVNVNYAEEETGYGFMVFNATFNSISVISWRSVLMMEET